MAMDTYDLLVEKVQSWLNRENFPDLDIEIEDLMAMAQRRIYRLCDFKIMEKKISFQFSTPTVPTDYLRTKRMRYSLSSAATVVLDGSTLDIIETLGTSDTPYLYTIDAGDFVFGPAPAVDRDIDLTYYYPLPLLAPANQTNWFSENIPELILFGTLLEASLWLKDDNRAAVWEGRFMATKDEQESSERRADKEPGSMRVRRRVSPGFESVRNNSVSYS